MEDVTGAPSAPAEPVVTPTAVDTAVSSGDQAAYREARRAERSGKPLEAPPAASPAAEPVDQAASTDASKPASEPAPPKKNADTRKAELAQEIQQELRRRDEVRSERIAEEARLAALRTPQPPDVTQAAPSPAAAASRAKPTEDDIGTTYATYADFTADLADWIAEQRITAWQTQREQADAQTRQRASAETAVATFSQRWREGQAAHPDLVASIDPQLSPGDARAMAPASLLPAGTPIVFGNVLADVLLTSESPVALAAHLSNRAEQDRLVALATQPGMSAADRDRAFYRAIGRIEARLTEPPAAPASTPQTITSAPAPPRTLGSRPADTANPIDSAVANDDVSAYRAARLKERLAQLR